MFSNSFFVGIFLAYKNYTPGTLLSGWDTLHPEFNYSLYWSRIINGVWQEHQGLGAVAAQAHAAEIPRVLILMFLDLFLPVNAVRYAYAFLALVLGPLGVYAFIAYLEHQRKLGSKIGAFAGGLLYLLNLGTLQHFYVPLEMFLTQYAALGWLFLLAVRYVDGEDGARRKKDLALFALVTFFAAPQAHTSTLFLAYLMGLTAFLLGSLLASARRLPAITILVITLLINSFWLLPQFYFLKTNSRVVSEAKANQLATEDVFYQNLEKGNISSFLKLEGFYFDLKGINNTFLFAPWKNHFSNPAVGVLPYLFGVTGVLGILLNLKKKKNLGFILIYFLSATALLLATPPFSWINELLRKNFIVNQIFRSPFTKFIIPYSLIYSYFVVEGVKIIVRKRIAFIYLVICFLIFIYSLPSFQGFFISPEMKIKIPEDYQTVISYFKNIDKNSRIALSPDYTYWGWFFNKWGYNGSGFLWYGIEQPIVSRTFDVWSKASESYFWEIKTAFEAENIGKILQVFDKYQVDYLILDKSLIPLVSSYKALQYDRIDELLMKSSKITLVFAGKNIFLYKIDHDYQTNKFVSLTSSLINIDPKISITNDDQAFLENSFYTNGQSSQIDIFYPFLSLTSQTNLKEKNWQISEDDNYFYLSILLTISPDNFDFYLSDIYQELVLVDGQPVNLSLKLQPVIEDKKFTVRFEKIALKNFNTQIDQKTNFGFSDLTLPQHIGYLIKTKSINNQGLPLFFYIIDETKKQSYLEDRLNNQINYFILSPRFDYGLGYTFAFQNKSFKNLAAANNLDELSLYLFPYKSLKEMKFVRKGLNRSEVIFSNDYEVNKLNYFTYQIQNNDLDYNNIILFQTYDPGWIAIANGKILSHVKVNNWANGWLTDSKKVLIIFWPQYLEFLGFALLVIVTLRILLIKNKNE